MACELVSEWVTEVERMNGGAAAVTAITGNYVNKISIEPRNKNDKTVNHNQGGGFPPEAHFYRKARRTGNI